MNSFIYIDNNSTKINIVIRDNYNKKLVFDGFISDKMLSFGHVNALVSDNTLDVLIVYVSEDFRGMGLASFLMQAIIDYSKENNYNIIPTCPYAKKYLEKTIKF